MTPRELGRTVVCDRRQARVRLEHAVKYRETAELVATEGDTAPVPASVGAGLAVLAGMAAADAACCAALGRRARGQDPKQALGLLARIDPGGPDAARNLERLLSARDGEQGMASATAADVRRALRRAAHLVGFAQSVLTR